MKKILAIILVLCCCLPAAAKKRQNEEIITPLSQLEKRQFQTRTYPAQDNVIAMKAILNVLQDEGFIVYNVNSLLGYIYGVKDFDLSDPNIDISKEFGVTKSRLNYNGVKVATLEVSVNVTQYGGKSRIRANFKRKLLNQYGNAQMIDDISEIEFYDDFYSKVDAAMNLQKQISDKVQNTVPVQAKQTVISPKTKTAKPVAEPVQETKEEQILNDGDEKINDNPASVDNDNSEEVLNTKVQEVVPETKKEKIKHDETKTEQEVKEETQSKSGTELNEEINVEQNEEHASADNPKELKELIKQAKQEAKQAKKEAKQAEKEARKAEKEAIKAAKQQAKDNEE